MKARVVITDLDFPSSEPEVAVLSRVPAEVELFQCRTPEEVLEAASEADGLIVQYAPITREVIKGLRRCRVIARYGVGVDTVDLAAASEAGIAVCNVPDYCIDEVSDHALALMLACARYVPRLNHSVRSGVWSVTAVAPRMERLSGQRLGLVGFGAIARAVARKAQVFGLGVSALDPFVDEATMASAGVEKASDLTALLSASDFISLHVPLIPSTSHLIGQLQLSLMKPTAYLINTSRGGLVDEEALYTTLAAGRIAGAALDVVENEPLRPDDPLLSLDNLIVTPHAAFYSQSSIVELQTRAAEAVATALTGGVPRSVLNREAFIEHQQRRGLLDASTSSL